MFCVFRGTPLQRAGHLQIISLLCDLGAFTRAFQYFHPGLDSSGRSLYFKTTPKEK